MGEARHAGEKNADRQRAQPIKQRQSQNSFSHIVRARTASATSHRLHDGLRAFGSGFLILIFARFTHPTGWALAAPVLLNGIRRP
jgi:hypothetical protein